MKSSVTFGCFRIRNVKMSLLKYTLFQRQLYKLNMGNFMSYSVIEPAFLTGIVLGCTSTYLYTRRKQVKGKETEDVLEKYHEENFEFPDPGDECRLVMCIRNDLKMQKGKVAAQCGHAAIAAYVKGMKHAPKMVKRWMTFGGTKITLRLDSQEELFAIDKKAKDLHVLTSIVRDAGQTQVAPGSRTVIAVGPAPQSVLNKITGHLKLY